MILNFRRKLLAACVWLFPAVSLRAETHDAYDVPFVAEASYDAALPTADALLGYKLGTKAATAEEVQRCVKAWAEASVRAELVEYAQSYEGRPLHYVLVSDPANLTRL